jgi:dihydroneopterin aldolase
VYDSRALRDPELIDPEDTEPSSSPAKKPMNEVTRSRIQRAIKLSQLFERASRATRETALAAAEVDIFPGGTLIVKQGATPDALLIIGRGRVRIERDAGAGRVVPLGYRGSGEVLGEACLGHESAQAENATAMEETEIDQDPAARGLDEMLATDPALSSALLGVLLARQREAEDRIESLLFRNVEGRVVEFLLKAAERWGVPSPKGHVDLGADHAPGDRPVHRLDARDGDLDPRRAAPRRAARRDGPPPDREEPRGPHRTTSAVAPDCGSSAPMLPGRRMSASVETYRIRLEGIRFRARHGASRAERDLPQDFVVNLDVALPVSALPRSDTRARVFDYDQLASLVVDEGTRVSYKLLETLAERLIARVLADTPAIMVQVLVKKFGPPTSASVDAVAIELTGAR